MTIMYLCTVQYSILYDDYVQYSILQTMDTVLYNIES